MAEFPREYEPEQTKPSGISKLAVMSFVLSLLGYVCLPIVGGLIGAVLGIMALVRVSDSGSRQTGRGLAIAAIVLGSFNVFLVGPLLLVALLLPAVQRVRAAANRMVGMNNLRQIGIGLHEYHTVHNELPRQAILDKEGQPVLSWRVALLPYLDQKELYQQFHLDEPWDSPHNLQLLEKMPKVYKHPSRVTEQPGGTYYQALFGKNAVFDPSGKVTLPMLTVQDGTSTTMMLAEAADAVPWTKPEDLAFDPNPGAPLPQMGDPNGNGFSALFGDCSVRFVRKTVDPEALRRLIDRRDGRNVNWNDIE